MEHSAIAWRSRLVSGAAAIALAAGLASAAAPASALGATSAEGYVTCASSRAAEPAPEILGLSNVGTNDAWENQGQLKWSAPLYYLIGTSEYNSNPDPFYANAVENTQNGNSNAQPTVTFYNRQGGPMAAMYAYQSGKDEGSDAVWEMLPDVILGTGNDTSMPNVYEGAAYAPAVSAALGADYNPVGVTYDRRDLYTMINTVWNLSDAAEQVVADTGKKLRYGDSAAIARQYESYIRGTQGYILKQTGGEKAKKVALVQNYDASTGVYNIVVTGVAEGTASANRYLEAVQNVAVNIADTLPAVTVGSGRDAATVAQVKLEDLQGVDLVLLGSQAGTENITSTEDILASFPADVLAKTFWVNSGTSSAGSMYGVVMNSTENAQNIGRILGCLYPEYIDQDDWVAYYYDNFYHINSGKLGDALDNAMDGVRNWDATGSELTSWTTADASTYSKSAVEAKLAEGMNYIIANETTLPSLLTPSSWFTGEPVFSDVAMNTWYGPSVKSIVEKKLMKGYSGATYNNVPAFGVGDPMKREDFAVIMCRQMSPADDKAAANTTGLPDVASNSYYSGAVDWAVANNIMGVGTSTFGVGQSITFEQMVTIIKRTVAPNATADASVLSKYADAGKISSFATDAMAWAVQQGLIGVGTDKLDPTSNVARERVATVLDRAISQGILK